MASESTSSENGRWISAAQLPGCEAAGGARLPSAGISQALARAEAQQALRSPADKPCQQQLLISFFFDGTGNNKYQDAPKQKLSNVARLFEAHVEDDPATGIIRVYIPGVGTPFPEVGDDGGLLDGGLGNALAGKGEARLQYAMGKFDDALAKAEARATNPANKILGIHVAIFGFSRGAAKARAFAVRLQARLQSGAGGWVLKDKGYPLRIYFMGLFDTVASVGISNTVRNREKREVLRRAASGVSLPFGGLVVDAVLDHSEAMKGHNAWASELRIPPVVERCMHYTAAHEVRESFPLDTVRVAASAKAALPSQYPAVCTEKVYPGMHSDVGGGYLPGEQGRAAGLDEQLSQIPLLHMYEVAREAGVPIVAKSKLKPEIKDYFQLAKPLVERYEHYRGAVGASGSVEQQNAAHLYLYYRWRKLRATTEGDPYLKELEARRQRALAEEKKHAEAISQLMAGPLTQLGKPRPPSSPNAAGGGSFAELRAERAQESRQRDIAYRQAQAGGAEARKERKAIEGIAQQIQEEDQRFIDDCKAVEQRALAKEPLSLHEQTLLRAWRAPLFDDKTIIDFFDLHVHDSVAGFRLTPAGLADNSYVSRPRDVYQGRQPWAA